jgi:hypothetical protein
VATILTGMPRKTLATPKKPPAPSVPKPADKLDPAVLAANKLLGGTPSTMRERRWTQLYILGATSEEAAAEARTHHANTQRIGKRR